MKWFRHMTAASDDEFLAALMTQLGVTAYGRWWLMLEKIGAQMDNSRRCHLRLSVSDWNKHLRTKGKSLAEFMLFCLRHNKVELRLFGSPFAEEAENILETFSEDSENILRTFLKHSQNILEIECRNLLKVRDNYSRNSQVTAQQETETETETEGEEEEKPPADAGDAAAAADGKGSKIPNCPHTEIIALYHEILPMAPAIKEIDTTLQTNLRARWRSRNGHGAGRWDLEWWRTFFLYIRNQCPFLIGQKHDDNRRPFNKGLRWMVEAGNFAKIVEHHYRDGGPK